MKNQETFSLRERSIYRAVQAMLKKDHPTNYDSFIISPSYLRCEKPLVNTSGKYVFDLKKVGGEQIQEVKLDRNDLFVITRLGLFLSLQATATPGKEVLQTYPNILIFPASATGLVAADLELIYNGFLSLKIGNKTNIENLSNLEFRYVPSTQQAAATTKSENNLTDCTYKPAALISLHGTMDIQFTVEFPTIASMGLTPTTAATDGTTKLVLMPFGFLIKGAANKK